MTQPDFNNMSLGEFAVWYMGQFQFAGITVEPQTVFVAWMLARQFGENVKQLDSIKLPKVSWEN